MKKPIKKLTKKQIVKQERIAKKKAWTLIAKEIRQRDGNVCVICGQSCPRLNVHHLIPREVKEYWLEPMNLISLCPRHHKFSITESFHKSPFWSFKWMQAHRLEQLNWIMEKYIIQ